tara:strand:- start:682 stop:915 length:234 start_codon:yes stop_codon:yes gene_type:complete
MKETSIHLLVSDKEDTYIDLNVVHTIKLCMHEELITKGLIVLDNDGDYIIVEEKYRELIDYVYENSNDPVVDLTVGD